MDIRIPLSDLDYGEEEQEAVLQVLQSRWLTMGAMTQKFEQEFADYVGVKHAIAVSNATTALHLACVSLGIGPGDEVIVPSLTFVATANAVLYTGAQVRFSDIGGLNDFNISPAEIEKKLGPLTKAIVVMHYGGYPCQMEKILDLARHYHLSVIEDAAHAVGASLDGRSLGTLGDVGCYSFFSNKNLATGEGGMLVTNRDDIAECVRKIRSHGMTSLTLERHRGHAYTYDVVALGYNYRIDEIHSALGRVQLAKLDRNNARRREITNRYRSRINSNFEGIGVPFENSPGQPACHIFPLLLPEGVNRQIFMETMRARGIQTSIHYPPIHRFSYYVQRYDGVHLPLTEAAADREVTLPLYPTMQDDDIEVVLTTLEEVLEPYRIRAVQ